MRKRSNASIVFFTRAVGEGVDVRVQSPLAIAEDSEPEPDLALVKHADDWTAHPSHAFLVIEVASSSLSIDRKLKKQLYATAKVPEYWVVNLVDAIIDVSTLPVQGTYQETVTYTREDSFALTSVPGLHVRAGDFLPDAP